MVGSKVCTVYSITGSEHSTVIEFTLHDTTQRFDATETLNERDGSTAIGTLTSLDNDVYSTLEYATGKKWVSIATTKELPHSLMARGGKFDEFHMVLVDTDGNVTGNPGTLIESFTYLSKAGDVKLQKVMLSSGRKFLN